MAGETTSGDELTLSPVGYEAGGYQVCVLDKTHEITTGELELNDVVNMGTVPAGAIYLDGFLATDDLDAGTAVVMTVGDTDDTDGLLAVNTVGQAGGVARFDGAYLVTRETKTSATKIDVKITTAPTTAQAGTVRVVLFYIVP